VSAPACIAGATITDEWVPSPNRHGIPAFNERQREA